jgi:hypothetical protein
MKIYSAVKFLSDQLNQIYEMCQTNSSSRVADEEVAQDSTTEQTTSSEQTTADQENSEGKTESDAKNVSPANSCASLPEEEANTAQSQAEEPEADEQFSGHDLSGLSNEEMELVSWIFLKRIISKRFLIHRLRSPATRP